MKKIKVAVFLEAICNKNQAQLLFMPISIHTCQQKAQPSSEPVPLKQLFIWMA
jgi:hypothetical protein